MTEEMKGPRRPKLQHRERDDEGIGNPYIMARAANLVRNGTQGRGDDRHLERSDGGEEAETDECA
jgi:hypothetical protein